MDEPIKVLDPDPPAWLPVLRWGSLVVMAAAMIGPCQAQSTGRAAVGGMAKALGDLADKYIEQDLAIERMRIQAELDAQVRRSSAQTLRQAPPTPERTMDEVDRQMAVLDRTFPAWDKVIRSTAFLTWLTTRPDSYQGMCKSTKLAGVMLGCIGDFLDARILAAN